jgi:hypothetical protein
MYIAGSGFLVFHFNLQDQPSQTKAPFSVDSLLSLASSHLRMKVN